MGKIKFDVDAYTARLIGRENVSRLESAVAELVKNTYDADASCCVLYYEKSTNTLYLADNGCGMTSRVIKKHWMTIGNSSKKRKFTSKKGRIQTGAKGIGRFALDRIGDSCTMFTKSNSGALEWSVDWTSFSDGTPLTSVSANLDSVTYSVADFISSAVNDNFKECIKNEFKATCTVFKIYPVRDVWNEKQIKKLRSNLITLVPQEISGIFNIYFFEEPTTIEDAKLIPSSTDSNGDYKIAFDVVGDSVKVKISRNEFDFKAKREVVLTGAGFSNEDREFFGGKEICHEISFCKLMSSRKIVVNNTIGNFSGVFLFSKIQQQVGDKEKYYYKSGNQTELPWKGVRIYRDNFRVRPYGDPDSSAYDWLLLSNRKAKSPAAPSHVDGKWRVSADQICGTVLISRTNITLPDQANREGFVETPEFQVLKNFLLKIIEFFESDRQYVFRKLNSYYEKTHPTQQFEDEISKKAAYEEKKKEHNEQPNAVDSIAHTTVEASKAKAVIEERDARIQSLEDENQLLRALATVGIVTNTYVHEIRGGTNTLGLKLVMTKEELEYDRDIDNALKYIDEAIACQESFGAWFKVTIDSVRKDRRTMKDVNLQELLEELRISWMRNCSDTEITVECESIFFRCFPYEIESIINNLIANSTSVFKTEAQTGHKISIQVETRDNFVNIYYQDNGPGLSDKYKKNPDLIMEAMETDKTDSDGEIIGTGMGMWIIGKTVKDYNGTVDLSKNIDSERGFHVEITLKGRR
ncbi:MAG: sensor histidine kinase [Lachnospiraceae bacterium]|nr:sensor histidine kinase [Lachnospiraceae bacterium]